MLKNENKQSYVQKFSSYVTEEVTLQYKTSQLILLSNQSLLSVHAITNTCNHDASVGKVTRQDLDIRSTAFKFFEWVRLIFLLQNVLGPI